MPIVCPVCFGNSKRRLTKFDVDYHQCDNCKTLFSEPLVNDNMVGGTNEHGRNENNIGRIERLKKYGYKILDYGCGNGLFVDDLVRAGFNANGYDKFSDKFHKLPNDKNFDAITLIEVIEHLSYPFQEIKEIYDLLKPGGVLYIETSFVDIADQLGITLEEYQYVNPNIGHSTIFSHKGLDILMKQNKFEPINHLNRNVRQYVKI